MGDRETILGEIARQQAVVERLDREREQARERLRALEGSLRDVMAATSPTTSAEKVALFRSLFRHGRRCHVGRAFLRRGWISRHRIGPSARAFGCQQTVTGFVSHHEGRES